MKVINAVFRTGIAAAVAFLLLSLPACKDTPQEEPGIVNPEPLEKVGPEGMFVAYDEPPMPIGGFEAIQKNLRYPPAARAEGFEGRVILNVLVDEYGKVDSVMVLKSSGREDVDRAAMDAVRSTEWKPAMHKSSPVKVWVGIPVLFRMNKSSEHNGPPAPPPEHQGKKQELQNRVHALDQAYRQLVEIAASVHSEYPDLEGAVTVKLSLAGDGYVMSVEPAESDRSHPTLRKAILEKLRNARLFETGQGKEIPALELKARLQIAAKSKAKIHNLRWLE